MTSELRALLAAPVRQFQVVAVLTVAAFAWLAIPVHAFGYLLPRGGLAETFADLTAGDAGTRWASFYVYLVTWGSVVAVCALALWGAALAVHSIVVTARQDPRLRGSGTACVPPTLAFWGSLALGALAHHVSANVSAVTSSPFWDDVYGASSPAVVLWVASAAATALAALVRGLRATGRAPVRARQGRGRR
ncbi:MAG TPA: hypothetical protein VKY79_06220 [Actinomycetaceae bacterium]|nr:hypothetical protein [Actinomycetaceae bacterium]